MNAQQMLAMGGFPDTAEGRQAFYNQYPDEASFHEKMKTGGSSGLAFPQQPTAGEFYAPQYTPNSPVGFYKPGGASGYPNISNDKVVEYGNYQVGTPEHAIFMSLIAPDLNKADLDRVRKMQEYAKQKPIPSGLNRFGHFLNVTMPGYILSSGARAGEKVGLTANPELFPDDQYNNPAADSLSPAQRQMKNFVDGYAYGGTPNAFPQQPPADMFFSGHPFTPEYARGGMPCMDCGGYMDDGGQASPFGYGQMPPTMGMAYGGSAKSFSKAMKKHFDDGGTASQGSSMEQNYNQQTKAIQAFIGGNVTNALATEEYNKPVYDIGGESTFNYGQADQLNAMQNNLDISEQQRQYQKQQSLSNLINSYALGGLPQAQMGTASDAERMFGQAPSFGKKTSPLFFGHTQGSTAANATSGSLNPEMTAKGNQLAQDIHNFNPTSAGVRFTPEQLRYLQQMGYGRQQQQGYGYNPGYRIKTKGFSNSADGTQGTSYKTRGTSDSPYPTFGPGPQGPGSFNMSRGLNEQQVADMNKYYNAHGMHMDYDQKNGFLGQLFGMGPRSIKMHIGSLSDHNQKNPAQSAQSATAASSSNPSGGGFHPFDGMRKRMAERKYNRSGDAMSDADAAQYDAENVTAADRQRIYPAMNRSQMNELSDLPVTNFNAYKQPGPTVRAYGGTPSVYLPHGYQEGGFNEVENDDYEDDGDYEYMDENEIAAYMAAGGVIKYV